MSEDYPIIRKRKADRFPLGGERRSQTHVNDNKRDENKRRHHGTDPLKDGWDTGEDPVKDKKPRPEVDIPIR